MFCRYNSQELQMPTCNSFRSLTSFFQRGLRWILRMVVNKTLWQFNSEYSWKSFPTNSLIVVLTNVLSLFIKGVLYSIHVFILTFIYLYNMCSYDLIGHFEFGPTNSCRTARFGARGRVSVPVMNLFLWWVVMGQDVFQVLLLVGDSRCMFDTHNLSPLPITWNRLAATWAGSPLFGDDWSTSVLGIDTIWKQFWQHIWW